MKRANEHARAIRKFYQTLLRRYGRPRIPPVREPIDELMYAVLSRWAPEVRAMAAVERLRRASIDLNDLRVTPVVEIMDTLGDDFPRARETAEALYRVLNGVFNRRYTLDLSFLKSMGKRDRDRLISGVSGIDAHDSGMFLLRCYRGRHVPVSPDAYAFLRYEGLVDPEASTAEIRAFLTKVIPSSQSEIFACLLKRHLAANPLPAEALAPAPAPAVAIAAPPVVAPGKKGAPEAASKPGANSDKLRATAVRTSPKAPPATPSGGNSRPAGGKPVKTVKPIKRGAGALASKARANGQAQGGGLRRKVGEKRRRPRSGSRR